MSKLNDLPPIDGVKLEAMIMALGELGRAEDTGVSRTVYSPEWVEANALLAQWGEAAGLRPRMDAVGNLWLRAEGSEGGKAIVSGSHVDTQCPGGRYDGALGILAALIAVETLIKTYGQPRRPVEVLSLCEEEGSRFPKAAFWGSRGITGRITPADLEEVLDLNGQPISAAMREVGLDPARVAEAKRDDLAAFIELHIEQGPVLEEADLPVAVVSAITSILHREVVLEGEANHAGAFPMRFRRDPMAGFAEIASGVIDHAYRIGAPAVSTIGRMKVEPNGAAIIPERVTFTLDSRHPVEAEALKMAAAQEDLIRAVAARRGLKVSITPIMHHEARPCDAQLQAELRASADAAGIGYLTMSSGAAHDSQQIAALCPVAMVFVRSEGGRSHTPAEFSTMEDIVAGVQVLMGALYKQAWS